MSKKCPMCGWKVFPKNPNKLSQEEIKKLASDLSTKWYCSEYGGWSWKTADEIVETFILWIHENGGEIREGK